MPGTPAIFAAPLAIAPVAASARPPPDAAPRAAVSGTTSRSSAGRIRTDKTSSIHPASTSVGLFPLVSENADANSRAAAGLYSSHATSQPTCLRHHDSPHSHMDAAAASGSVPVSAISRPTRITISMSWISDARITSSDTISRTASPPPNDPASAFTLMAVDQPLVPRCAEFMRLALHWSPSHPAAWTMTVAAAVTNTRRTRPVSITLAGSPRRRIASRAAATRMQPTATRFTIHRVSPVIVATGVPWPDSCGVPTLIQNVPRVFSSPSAADAIGSAISASRPPEGPAGGRTGDAGYRAGCPAAGPGSGSGAGQAETGLAGQPGRAGRAGCQEGAKHCRLPTG